MLIVNGGPPSTRRDRSSAAVGRPRGSVIAAHRHGPRIRLSRQIAIIAVALTAYNLARVVTEGTFQDALRNAHRIIDVEKLFGIYREQALQAALATSPVVTTILNGFYIWGYWPVIGVTLFWLARRHPATYLRLRNSMIMSCAIGLVVFVLFPVAPPRLAGLGMIDTLTLGSDAKRALQPVMFTNQYAAMPSLHVGWELLIGLAIFAVASRPLVRVLGLALPVAMFVTVVLTANHYVVDAVAGAALTGTCWFVAGRWQSRRPRLRLAPVSPAPAGAARTDRAPVSQAPIGAGAPVGLLRPRRIPMASVGAHDSTPDDELVA